MMLLLHHATAADEATCCLSDRWKLRPQPPLPVPPPLPPFLHPIIVSSPPCVYSHVLFLLISFFSSFSSPFRLLTYHLLDLMILFVIFPNF